MLFENPTIYKRPFFMSSNNLRIATKLEGVSAVRTASFCGKPGSLVDRMQNP